VDKQERGAQPLDPHEVDLASRASCGEIAGMIDVRVRVGVSLLHWICSIHDMYSLETELYGM
jgi:hypothetical protein